MEILQQKNKIFLLKRTIFTLFILFLTNNTFAQNIKEINEVTVISNRAQNTKSTSHTYVITQDEIKDAPVQSIEDLLDYAVNVDLRQRGMQGVQSDISIRGGSFEQVLVLLNGVKINDPQTGHHSTIIPISIEQILRIEILTGGASRIFGNYAYTGVVNIVTKKQNDNSLIISNGSNNYKSLEMNFFLPKKNEFNHSFSFSSKTSEGYISGMDFDLKNFFYQANREFKNLSTLVNVALSDKKFGAYSFYTPKYPDQYEKIKTGIASFQLNYNYNRLSIRNKIYVRKNADQFILFRENPEWYHNFHKTDVYGMDFNITQKTKNGSNVIGFEIIQDKIISNRLGEVLSSPINIDDQNSYTLGGKRSNINMFVEKNIYLENLSISGGVMANISNNFNEEFFPGIDIKYNFSKNLQMSMSHNKSMRNPNYTELYYLSPTNQGNKNLKSEQSKNREFSVTYKNKKQKTQLSFYQREGINMIDWILINGDSIWRAENLGQIKNKGFELSSTIYTTEEIERFLGVNSLKINYAINHSDTSSIGFQSAYVLDYLKSNLSISLNQEFKDMKISWKATRQDRNGNYIDFLTNNEIEYKPFWLFSSRLTKNIFSSHEMFFEVFNLFNIDYVDFGNVPQPKRWMRFGIKIKI